MDLKENIDILKNKFAELQNRNPSEANTQFWLINPFLKSLGYNTSDPGLVHHQFNADPNDSKTGIVDYAILRHKRPIIFIEAKKLREPLDNYVGQIRHYFNNVWEVDFAILTNGNEYRFYTDLDRENMCDDEPFLLFELNDIDEELIQHLGKFSRQSFDSRNLRALARTLSRRRKIHSFLVEQFAYTSDSFVNFISKEVFSTSKQEVRNQIRQALPGVFQKLNDEPKPPPPPNSGYKNIFNIGNGTHRRLDSYCFQNETFSGENWASMFVRVIVNLHKENAQKLMSISEEQEALKITSDETSIRNAKDIGDGLFVSTNNSTEVKVRCLCFMLTEFGMKDALWVKLRSTKHKPRLSKKPS